MTTNMFDLSMYMLLGRNMTSAESDLISDYVGEDLITENNLLAMFSEIHDLGRNGATFVKDCDARFYDLCDAVYVHGLHCRSRNHKEIEEARNCKYHEYYVSGYTVLDKKMGGHKCDKCGVYTVHYIAYKDGVTRFQSFDLCEDCDDTIYDVLDPEGTGGIII